jgi:hypothetical protein
MASLHSEGSQRSQGGVWGWWEHSQLTRGLADVAFALEKGKHSKVFGRTLGDDYWIYLYEQGKAVTGRHYVVDPETHKQKLGEERRFTDDAEVASLPSPNEFYLLQLDELQPAHTKPLSEVREQVEQTLLVQERTRLEKAWLSKLRKKTFVRYF